MNGALYFHGYFSDGSAPSTGLHISCTYNKKIKVTRELSELLKQHKTLSDRIDAERSTTTELRRKAYQIQTNSTLTKLRAKLSPKSLQQLYEVSVAVNKLLNGGQL